MRLLEVKNLFKVKIARCRLAALEMSGTSKKSRPPLPDTVLKGSLAVPSISLFFSKPFLLTQLRDS